MGDHAEGQRRERRSRVRTPRVLPDDAQHEHAAAEEIRDPERCGSIRERAGRRVLRREQGEEHAWQREQRERRPAQRQKGERGEQVQAVDELGLREQRGHRVGRIDRERTDVRAECAGIARSREQLGRAHQPPAASRHGCDGDRDQPWVPLRDRVAEPEHDERDPRDPVKVVEHRALHRREQQVAEGEQHGGGARQLGLREQEER